MPHRVARIGVSFSPFFLPPGYSFPPTRLTRPMLILRPYPFMPALLFFATFPPPILLPHRVSVAAHPTPRFSSSAGSHLILTCPRRQLHFLVFPYRTNFPRQHTPFSSRITSFLPVPCVPRVLFSPDHLGSVPFHAHTAPVSSPSCFPKTLAHRPKISGQRFVNHVILFFRDRREMRPAGKPICGKRSPAAAPERMG